MTGIYHEWGQDLELGNTGSLRKATAAKHTEQRLTRRYFTNDGDMQDNPAYGAGVPQFIGQVGDIAKITATLRQQTRMETSISQSPAPKITVRPIGTDMVVADIQYAEVSTGAYNNLQYKMSR